MWDSKKPLYERTRTDRPPGLSPGTPKDSGRATIATLVPERRRWLEIQRGHRSAPGRREEIAVPRIGTVLAKLGGTAAILPGTGHRRPGRRSTFSNSAPKCGKSHSRRRIPIGGGDG